MKPFDLVVFDWDGTLMDSTAQIVRCIQAAARDVGLPTLADEIVVQIIGLGMEDACAQLFPGIDSVQIARLCAVYRQGFSAQPPETSALFAGAEQVCRDLRSDGYLVAIATGKSRGGLDRILKCIGMDNFFHATRCADETASKPHPRMLLEIMGELETSPERTVMVGDTSFDLELARNARTASIGVSYGAHPVSRLTPMGPVAVLDSIIELPDTLTGINMEAFSL